MFKKINKMYVTLFGESNWSSVPHVSGDTRPLVEEVESLKRRVKSQAQVLESLLRHLELESDYDFSNLGGDEFYYVTKKSKK